MEAITAGEVSYDCSECDDGECCSIGNHQFCCPDCQQTYPCEDEDDPCADCNENDYSFYRKDAHFLSLESKSPILVKNEGYISKESSPSLVKEAQRWMVVAVERGKLVRISELEEISPLKKDEDADADATAVADADRTLATDADRTFCTPRCQHLFINITSYLKHASGDLDGTGASGGRATLQDLSNKKGRIWNYNGAQITDGSNGNLCLDVFNQNFNSGGTVGEYTCNGGANQKWSYAQGMGFVTAFLSLVLPAGRVVKVMTLLNSPFYAEGYWKHEAFIFSRDAFVFLYIPISHGGRPAFPLAVPYCRKAFFQ